MSDVGGFVIFIREVEKLTTFEVCQSGRGTRRLFFESGECFNKMLNCVVSAQDSHMPREELLVWRKQATHVVPFEWETNVVQYAFLLT